MTTPKYPKRAFSLGPPYDDGTPPDPSPATRAGRRLVRDMGFTGERRTRLIAYIRDIEAEAALAALEAR